MVGDFLCTSLQKQKGVNARKSATRSLRERRKELIGFLTSYII